MRVVVWILLLGMTFLYLGCGESSKSSSRCGEEQVFASVDDVEGCFERCPLGVCSIGLVCIQEICVEVVDANNTSVNVVVNNLNNSPPNNSNNTSPNNASTNNTSTNNTSTNNTTTNNSTTNNTTNNATNNNNVNMAELEVMCSQACDRLYGSCITDNCTLSAEATTALMGIYDDCVNGTMGSTCAQTAANDPDFRAAVESLVTTTCDALSPLRCGEFGLTQACGCEAPTLGGPCLTSNDCDGGDLAGFCIRETNAQGNPTGYTNGYCSAVPCPIRDRSITSADVYTEDACGDGNLCVVIPGAQDLASFCVKGCQDGCRTDEGYACQVQTIEPDIVMAPVFVGSCAPACTSNADCGQIARCHVPSGRCELPCSNQPLGTIPGNPTPTQICVNSSGTCTQRPEGVFCVLP